MPPPSFTITAPPLRSIDDLDDDDTEIPRKTAVSKKSLQEPTKTERVIKSREKVALAPGHSALDWARIKGSGQYEGKSLKVRQVWTERLASSRRVEEGMVVGGTCAWNHASVTFT